MDMHELSIQQAHELLSSRKISAEELTRAYLERIQRAGPADQILCDRFEDVALEQARDADQRFKTGEGLTPLTGIPYSAKDSISTRGVRTTCSSKILETYKPFYDSTAIKKLKSTGSPAGQNQHGRIRHGFLHRELRFLHHAQPLELSITSPAARAAGRRRRSRRDWLPSPRRRHGRIGPHACIVLRHDRTQDHLRTRLPLRVDPSGLIIRYDRSHGTQRVWMCPGA
jgi:hypothetical protein